MKALLASGVVALALVGCANTPTYTPKPHSSAGGTAHTLQQNTTKHFVCDNGATPSIRTINHNQIEFTSPLGDATPTTLSIAPAASGERYVSKTGIYGKGGEWHQKGDMAVFTYYDVGSPTNCHAK